LWEHEPESLHDETAVEVEVAASTNWKGTREYMLMAVTILEQKKAQQPKLLEPRVVSRFSQQPLGRQFPSPACRQEVSAQQRTA